MPLRFEQRPADSRIGRGLVARAMETFHYAYAGTLEIGHFFCVPYGGGEIWRWDSLLPASETVGSVETAEEARQKLDGLYAAMLAQTGLVEPRPT